MQTVMFQKKAKYAEKMACGLQPISNIAKVSLVALTALLCISVASAQTKMNSFLIQIKNLSDYKADSWTFGEGVWVLHNQEHPLFKHGEALYLNGMKTLIERGKGHAVIANIAKHEGIAAGALFKTLDAKEKVAFVITASPGQRFSFVIPLNETNDKFIAPRGRGIKLFDLFAQPISSSATQLAHIWDGGSAYDEKPQQQKQTQGTTQKTNVKQLPDPNPSVRLVITGERPHTDGFRYPRVETILRISIKAF